MNDKNCRNCGAPWESHFCSYCHSPSSLFTPLLKEDNKMAVREDVDNRLYKTKYRYDTGWADVRLALGNPDK